MNRIFFSFLIKYKFRSMNYFYSSALSLKPTLSNHHRCFTRVSAVVPRFLSVPFRSFHLDDRFSGWNPHRRILQNPTFLFPQIESSIFISLLLLWGSLMPFCFGVLGFQSRRRLDARLMWFCCRLMWFCCHFHGFWCSFNACVLRVPSVFSKILLPFWCCF